MNPLLNCHGKPDPCLMSDDEARRAGLLSHMHATGMARAQRIPLHPALTEPHRLAALLRARETDQPTHTAREAA